MEENIEEIIGMKTIVEKEVGVGLGKDHFQGILITEGMTEAQATVDQGQDPGASTDRNRTRCYKYRESNHFAKIAYI